MLFVCTFTNMYCMGAVSVSATGGHSQCEAVSAGPACQCWEGWRGKVLLLALALVCLLAPYPGCRAGAQSWYALLFVHTLTSMLVCTASDVLSRSDGHGV